MSILLLILFSIVNVTYFEICEATTDLNLREVQYISDHLTMSECRKLSEALAMDGFALEYQPTGQDEISVSCITLLLAWDRSNQGRGRTFHVLATRLRQINRDDLADYLSTTVYHEKSQQVEDALLSDPFKKNLPADIPLLKNGPTGVTDKSVQHKTSEERKWTWTQLTGFIGGSLSIVAIVVYLIGCCTNWNCCINVYEHINEAITGKQRKLHRQILQKYLPAVDKEKLLKQVHTAIGLSTADKQRLARGDATGHSVLSAGTRTTQSTDSGHSVLSAGTRTTQSTDSGHSVLSAGTKTSLQTTQSTNTGHSVLSAGTRTTQSTDSGHSVLSAGTDSGHSVLSAGTRTSLQTTQSTDSGTSQSTNHSKSLTQENNKLTNGNGTTTTAGTSQYDNATGDVSVVGDTIDSDSTIVGASNTYNGGHDVDTNTTTTSTGEMSESDTENEPLLKTIV